MRAKIINRTIILVYLALLSSCVPTKKLEYTQSKEKDIVIDRFENIRKEKIIQAYDKLYIKVYSLDPNIAQLFTDRNTTGLNTNLNLISYTVDAEGFIDFPFVGKIKVKGLNLDNAKTKIEDELSKYLSNISIILRYIGNKITVLGEVNREGEYPFYDDKINIFQAISYAGGVNNFGDKTRIKIIREVDSEIKYFMLDLTKRNIVESPNYYLQPNDIILVEPIKAKYRGYRDFALFSLMFSSVSTLILILNYYNQNIK